MPKPLTWPWCWERLKVGGEGDDRGWDGWMASPTQGTWIWINSRSWWWTGRPGPSPWGCKLRHDWGTELNWKPLIVWITVTCRKFFKRWEYQTTWPASWESCMLVKKQQLEPDMEQQTGSKSGKEYVKAVYCHPAYLISMQSTSCEMLDWMNHKLESRLPGEIPVTSDMQMTPPLMAESKEELKSLLMKMKKSGNAGLKVHIQKTKIMASGPSTSWQIDGKTIESDRLYFLGLQDHCRWWLQPWNSKMFAPWKKSYDKPRQHIKKQRHCFSDKGLSSQSYGFSTAMRVGP